MEPKIGDWMKVSPQLTNQNEWITGEVIDVEHNPFLGLVISIKDQLGRIFLEKVNISLLYNVCHSV